MAVATQDIKPKREAALRAASLLGFDLVDLKPIVNFVISPNLV